MSDGPAFYKFFPEFSWAKTLSRFTVVNDAIVFERADMVRVSVGYIVSGQLRCLAVARKAGFLICWTAILIHSVLPLRSFSL